MTRKSRVGPRRRRRWLGAAVAGALLVAVAGAALAWWTAPEAPTAGGSPRLQVDRAAVDLGYLRFDQPARAAFTLANGGQGALRLAGVPPVVLQAGC